MTSFFDTAWKVDNPYALAAFLGVLILIFWSMHRHRKADSIAFVMKLLFGLVAAVVLLVSLDRGASDNSGQSNSTLFNSGTMSNTSSESR